MTGLFDDALEDRVTAAKNDLSLLGPSEIAHILDGLEALESWIAAVRAYAHTQAERGLKIPGWQLSDKIGNRIFTETDETKLAAALKSKFSLTDDQLYKKKILSPAQLEKQVGAKKKAEVDALCHKPIKGTNLVASAKTTRPAAKTKSETFFETVKD